MPKEIDIDNVKHVMNLHGKSKTPFFFVIDFAKEHAIIETLPLNTEEILYKCNEQSNYTPTNLPYPPFTMNKYPVTYEEYLKGFEKIQNAIKKGEISLVNYTQPTRLNIDLNIKDIFVYSKAKYKLWIKGQFVCFSPETFVTIEKGVISSFPMKGTIDASLPNAMETILNNEKEIEEHRNCVNLVSKELSVVAQNVHIEKFRYIDRIKNNQKELLQVSSKVSGELPQNYLEQLGDIFIGLLPASSIIGTPKSKSIELLKQVENYNRGYYTGVFGLFDGEKLDSGVLIRFIEQTDTGLFYKSGGGITSKSIPEKEYEEMINKVYVPIY